MYAAGIIWYNIEQLSPTINFFEQLQQFQMVTSSDRDYLLLMILNISACYMYDIYNEIDKQNFICWSFFVFTFDSCVQSHF